MELRITLIRKIFMINGGLVYRHRMSSVITNEHDCQKGLVNRVKPYGVLSYFRSGGSLL